APSRTRSSGGLVPRFLDRRAQQPVIEIVAAHNNELRLEVDSDTLDPWHLLKLEAHGVLAVGAAHAGDAVGELTHLDAPAEGTPPGYRVACARRVRHRLRSTPPLQHRSIHLTAVFAEMALLSCDVDERFHSRVGVLRSCCRASRTAA